MAPLLQNIQTLLDRGSALLTEFSKRWQPGANRRSIIALLVLGIFILLSYIFFVRPPENFPIGELIEVPKGQSLRDVAQKFEEEGVVRSGFALRTLVRLTGGERSVHAGDYLFKEPPNLFRVACALVLGAYGLEPVRIRILEGATVEEMAILFDRQFQRFDADNFLTEREKNEGYLFPDTYFFLPNATEDTIIEAMRQNFDEQTVILRKDIASSTRSLSDIVIMASLIEREARNSIDRRKISGVLWNRIAKGMPLQVDVAFLYTLGKYTFQLTNEDLQTDSPYNTYTRKGLPPTPIGSPSLDSLEAAFRPTKSEYLYFLADHSGVTHYCKTYSCHMANKARYF